MELIRQMKMHFCRRVLWESVQRNRGAITPAHEIPGPLSWACLWTSLSLRGMIQTPLWFLSTIEYILGILKMQDLLVFVISVYDTNTGFWDKKKKITWTFITFCPLSIVLKIAQISLVCECCNTNFLYYQRNLCLVRWTKILWQISN